MAARMVLSGDAEYQAFTPTTLNKKELRTLVIPGRANISMD